MARKLGVSTIPPVSAVRPYRPSYSVDNRERDPPCRNRTMAGSRSGAILPDPKPASATRAPVAAGARVAIPAERETPVVRVAGVVSEETTIAAMRVGAAKRTPGARDVSVRGPAAAASVVTGPVARSEPIALDGMIEPGPPGSAIGVATGQEAARTSGPRAHARAGRAIVPAVHGRTRVRTVTSASTECVIAGTSGRRVALPPVTRIEVGTIGVPGAQTAGAVWTTAGPVDMPPSGPLAVPTSVVSAVARPTVVTMGVVSAGGADPTGRIAGSTGRAGIGWGRWRATVVRDSPAVAMPEDRGVAAVRAGAVGPIVAHRGPTSPICPTRSRPVISILRSAVTC